jgi:hypothetical protein
MTNSSSGVCNNCGRKSEEEELFPVLWRAIQKQANANTGVKNA